MIKKRVIIFIFLVMISVFLIGAMSDNSKISKEVYGELKENNNVKVIVKINIEEEKGFIFKSKKSELEIEKEKEEIKEMIIEGVGGDDVGQVFEEEVAVEISREDLDELSKNENVEGVVLDMPMRAFLQDSVEIINISSVWPVQLEGINITGIDETVCIIDTGIDFLHPDLIGKNKTCVIDCMYQNCVENCSIGDDNGHGTHVAGIVGASGGIKGVGIGVNLIGVKALDSNGDGISSDVRAAIEWCSNDANIQNYNISVISMSLGGSLYEGYCNEDFLASSINNAVGKNISVIVATGNDGNSTAIATPACIENATAVGATTKTDEIASYSNRNSITDLFAPGGTQNNEINGINSTKANGGYVGYYGTSMAAPHVAGGFALFRQFFKLQNNRVPEPFEIQDELNKTGKQINDTAGQSLTFSRIDIYSSLINIDNSKPTVNLISPCDSMSQFNQNTSFICSANDVQLSNLTFYFWNSSDIYNTSIELISGINSEVEFNLTDIPYGDYEWNCLAYDEGNNFDFAESNYSFRIGDLAVNLDSPEDDFFTNQNQSFNCSAETEPTKQLSNVSFYLWNSTGDLIYILSENISGVSYSVLFNYDFSEEGYYEWNCLGYNNESEFEFSSSNYSLDYDVTSPELFLTSPDNDISYISNSQEINFEYNISEDSIDNCSLIVKGIIYLINNSIGGLTQEFMYSFGPGNYNWKINCFDFAGNNGESEERNFSITAPVVNVGGSSSSGGGSSGSSSRIIPNVVKNNYTIINKTDDKTETPTITYSSLDNDTLNRNEEVLVDGPDKRINKWITGAIIDTVKTNVSVVDIAMVMFIISIFVIVLRWVYKNEEEEIKER